MGFIHPSNKTAFIPRKTFVQHCAYLFRHVQALDHLGANEPALQVFLSIDPNLMRSSLTNENKLKRHGADRHLFSFPSSTLPEILLFFHVIKVLDSTKNPYHLDPRLLSDFALHCIEESGIGILHFPTGNLPRTVAVSFIGGALDEEYFWLSYSRTLPCNDGANENLVVRFAIILEEDLATYGIVQEQCLHRIHGRYPYTWVLGAGR